MNNRIVLDAEKSRIGIWSPLIHKQHILLVASHNERWTSSLGPDFIEYSCHSWELYLEDLFTSSHRHLGLGCWNAVWMGRAPHAECSLHSSAHTSGSLKRTHFRVWCSNYHCILIFILVYFSSAHCCGLRTALQMSILLRSNEML